MNNERFATVVAEDLAAYFEHLGARIDRLAGILTEEQLWAKPFGFGNSVGRIVVHLTGSLKHFIGAKVAGSGYVRDRPAEFAEGSHPTGEEARAALREVVAMVARTLRDQDEDGLRTPVTDCGSPVGDRFGLFLVCAGHVSNHVGQIAYLVQAHGYPLDDKSW